MRQTDFLIRIEHTEAYTEETLQEILNRSGVSGYKVTVLDKERSRDSNDPRNYSPYIAH